MTEILITKKDEGYEVVVNEGRSETKHLVTVSDEDHQRLNSKISKEELLKNSFEFLLQRESKESILRTFDIKVISQYFPEYEKEISS